MCSSLSGASVSGAARAGNVLGRGIGTLGSVWGSREYQEYGDRQALERLLWRHPLAWLMNPTYRPGSLTKYHSSEPLPLSYRQGFIDHPKTTFSISIVLKLVLQIPWFIKELPGALVGSFVGTFARLTVARRCSFGEGSKINLGHGVESFQRYVGDTEVLRQLAVDSKPFLIEQSSGAESVVVENGS